MTGIAKSVECSTAEWDVMGSIPGAGPILGVLEQLRNKETAFVLQVAEHLPGLDDHVNMVILSLKTIIVVN